MRASSISTAKDFHDPRDFWEALHAASHGELLVLDPGEFYILASKETDRHPGPAKRPR